MVVFAIGFLVYSTVSHRWKNCLITAVTFLLWIFIWCYVGWGINYFRSSIWERCDIQKVEYDRSTFLSFLTQYTEKLNASYQIIDSLDKRTVESTIKDYYKQLSPEFGLCLPKDFQHPKSMLFHKYQSCSGILGYIGPLFCETILNPELLPIDYPYMFAHEEAHLLGVSSEAEANWWAWNACKDSNNPTIQYSAYFSLLPHVVINAQNLLSDAELKSWASTIRPEIVEDFNSRRDYWQDKQILVVNKFQTWLLDSFLKSNGIHSGMKNYSEVIQLIIAVDNNDTDYL